MEILALIAGFFIAYLYMKRSGAGIIGFFVVWTIATMLSGIALAIFGFLFSLVLLVGIIIGFIWIVKKIIVG